MNIPNLVKQLNIDLSKCVVVSSGTMHVLGIREADDIDLAVTKDLYDELFNDGRFEHVELPWGGSNLKIEIDDAKIEIMPKLEWDKFPKTTQDVIDNSFQVDGVNFMSIEDLKGFKTALDREKDFRDLELIRKYEEGMEPNVPKGMH